EDGVDHEADALERLDRGAVAGQRRLADRPGADVAVQAGVDVRKAHVEPGGAELLGRREERVDVLGARRALREHGDRAALADAAQLELVAAHVGERRDAHGSSPYDPAGTAARWAF